MAQAAYKIAEARAHFSELVERARRGAEITIMRGQEVVARLVPAEGSSKRAFGPLRHLSAPEDLFDHDDPEQAAIDAGDYNDDLGIWQGEPAGKGNAS